MALLLGGTPDLLRAPAAGPTLDRMHERVLVVEGDEATPRAVRALLDDAGYRSDGASDGLAGLERPRGNRFDSLPLDLVPPRMFGGGRPPRGRRGPPSE